MICPTSLVSTYHEDLSHVIHTQGLDAFRVQPPRRSRTKTLRICCGGPHASRSVGFERLFGKRAAFIHARHTLVCNSLIGFMEAQVVVLFFDRAEDFRVWADGSAEAMFLKLTQPANEQKLFIVRCPDAIAKAQVATLVGSDNVEFEVDLDNIRARFGVQVALEPYIDSLILIPRGAFVHGPWAVTYLPAGDCRGVFASGSYLHGDVSSAEGAVFLKCCPEVDGAVNIQPKTCDITRIHAPWLLMQNLATRALCGAPSDDISALMTDISWFEARDIAHRLSRAGSREGWQPLRLPTEQEWEYAAKAQGPFEYSGSHILEDVGWTRYSGATNRADRGLGRLDPNAFGTYDMTGSIYEWCDTTDLNTEPTSEIATKIVKGGAWYTDSLKGAQCAARGSQRADRPNAAIGVRFARDVLRGEI